MRLITTFTQLAVLGLRQFFEGQGSPCVHLALFVGHRLFSRGCRSLQTLRKVNRAQDVDSIPSGVPEITTDFLPLRLASVTCRADRDTSRNPHRQLQAENDEHEKNRQKPPPKQHDDDDVNYVNFLLKVQLCGLFAFKLSYLLDCSKCGLFVYNYIHSYYVI